MALWHDTSYKRTCGERHFYHDRWIAETTVKGRRVRFYSKYREECEKWLLHFKHKKKYLSPLMQVLSPIPEFSGYYIDMMRCEVYSMKRNSFHKLTSRDNGVIHVTVNHKSRYLTIPRIIYSMEHGISYYDIPKDSFVLRLGEERGIQVDDKSSFMLEVNSKKKKRLHEDRLVLLKNNIKVLQLLMLAFQGESLPLIMYVEHKKSWYMERIYPSSERAQLGYSMALDHLLTYLSFSNAVIYNFDGWFVKTARRLLTSKRIWGKRHVSINERIM